MRNILFFCMLSCILHVTCAQLKVGFYSSTCPKAESIVQGVVQQRFKADPSVAAALLRMYFHDCFVTGCDASILIDSTPSKSSEKDAGPNLSVRGFDLIDAAKKAVESNCSSTVSCADIIAIATRDAVVLSGGSTYNIPTGRRDGLDSDVEKVDLPGPTLTVTEAFQFFKAKKFTLNEMVILLGAHTIGVAQCGFFEDRLSNFEGSGKPDPTMDPRLAAGLSKTCGAQSSSSNQVPTAFLDQGSPFVLDNQFYNQTIFKRGVLKIDQELALDNSTALAVSGYAKNGIAFRQDFVNALIKLGNTGVITGKAGEIRKNCRVFNPPKQKSPRSGF